MSLLLTDVLIILQIFVMIASSSFFFDSIAYYISNTNKNQL